MAPLISTLRSAVSALRADVRPIDECISCGEPVYPDDRCVRVLGGGFAHAACATYRMRHGARIRRSLRGSRGATARTARTPLAMD